MTKWETAVLLAVLLVPVFSDLKSRRVPGIVIASGFFFRAMTLIRSGGLPSAGGAVLAAAVITVPVFLTVLFFDHVLARKTMGGGDLKYLALLTFSFPAMTSLYGLLIGLVSAAAGTVLFRRTRREKVIPLTPFLLAGYEAALMFGL